jgi:hypothetical protein
MLRRKAWLFVLCLLPFPARAQFTGFSVPQTITTTPFNTVSCTGAEQVALIPNLGQTEHFISVGTASITTGFRATIKGSHDGVTFSDISDVATTNGNTVEGQGYYPVVEISMTCAQAAGSFTIRYSGQATAPAPQLGAQASAQIDKTLASLAPANANFTAQQVRAPFGNTGGAIYFLYSGAGPSGSTLNVACSTLQINGTNVSIASFPISTSASLQIFPVALLPCDFVTVGYTSGGASGVTFQMSYIFNNSSITGGDPCQGSTAPKSSVPISLTATGQLVTLLTGHSIYVCGYSFTIAGSATATAQLEYGTGAACAAGTTSLSGTYLGNTNGNVIDSGGGGYAVAKTAVSNALCLALAGATPSAQGILTFVQQ